MRPKKKKFFKIIPLIPFFFILTLTLIIFSNFFIKGLIPAPLDFLVAFNFPWYSGGFEAYTPWVPFKGLLNLDVVRQVLPWKIITVDQLRQLIIPLWNPYNFSGTPLAANFQSAIFYPFNIVFFIFDIPTAWSILEVIQLMLGLYFMYLFLREHKLSQKSSFFGGVIFMLNTFMLSWMELNIIGHTLLWLPLALYFVEKYKREKKDRYLLCITISILFSILAGHPLSLFYTFFIYILYVLLNLKLSKTSFALLLAGFWAIVISSVQILPTIELFQNSFLDFEFGRKAFKLGVIPFKHLITFLAPGYYGNYSTGNWWGYGGPGDMTPFVGIVTIVLIVLSLLYKRSDRKVRFFILLGLVGLLIAFPTPVNSILSRINIPVLSSTSSARALILLYFSSAYLAGAGLDALVKGKVQLKKLFVLLTVIAATYLMIAVNTYTRYTKEHDLGIKGHFLVGLRNMVLPVIVFIITAIGLLLYLSLKKKRVELIYCVLLVNLFLFVYNANRYLSFAPKQFFFPKHILFDWLKNQGEWRFHGRETARVDTNYQVPYQVFSPAGYDVLRLRSYGEFAAASFDGFLKLSPDFSRADAYFPDMGNPNGERAFDLMGVKYLVNKIDDPKSDWEPQLSTFPSDKYRLVWQREKFQVYERTTVFPRVFLVNDYLVETEKYKRLETIFAKNIDLKKTIILSQEPGQLKLDKEIPSGPPLSGEAKITGYQPNRVKIKTESKGNSLLFLSDAYYPGWKAFVDGQEEEIYQTDHAFRSVFVPKGEHAVEFIYKPESFYKGLTLSASGLMLLFGFVFYSHKQKRL